MRTLTAYILLLLLPCTLQGQTGSGTDKDTKDPGFLLSTLSYTSNNNSSRLTNAIRMPAMMASVAYYSNLGLYLSADYFKYLAPDTNTYELEFKAGFEKTFLEKFDLDFSYTNRHFKGVAAYEGISYQHALDLSGSFRPGNFTATLYNTYMFGSTDNYFLDLSLSYDFKFEHFLLKSGYLVLSPTFSGSFGTTFWIPGTIGNTWGGHYGGGHMGGYVPERNFAYQNVSLILPVQYTLGSFTLSGGWFYAIPSKTLKDLNWTNQTGFLVSLSYVVIF
jgi:hypothetical protein